MGLAAKSGGLADSAKGAYLDPTDPINKGHIERMQAYVNDQVANNPGYNDVHLNFFSTSAC